MGGMVTKLQAADLARRGGTTTIIAGGREPDVIVRAARGEALGTRFPAVRHARSTAASATSGRLGRRTARLTVDAGAAQALRAGRSLLPVGVTARGRRVRARRHRARCSTPAGHELARGMVNYDAGDLGPLRGRRSERDRERSWATPTATK